MVDALHRDDGISYSTTLVVLDYTFDPTVHLYVEAWHMSFNDVKCTVCWQLRIL